eukprot:2804424-Rhodomonas_salina.2
MVVPERVALFLYVHHDGTMRLKCWLRQWLCQLIRHHVLRTDLQEIHDSSLAQVTKVIDPHIDVLGLVMEDCIP